MLSKETKQTSSMESNSIAAEAETPMWLRGTGWWWVPEAKLHEVDTCLEVGGAGIACAPEGGHSSLPGIPAGCIIAAAEGVLTGAAMRSSWAVESGRPQPPHTSPP